MIGNHPGDRSKACECCSNYSEIIHDVMNTLHNGYNSGKVPTTLVVFYTAAVGTPNVIKEKHPAFLPIVKTSQSSSSAPCNAFHLQCYACTK